MAVVDVLRTTKGKLVLANQGSEYCFAKIVGSGIIKYWRCVRNDCIGIIKMCVLLICFVHAIILLAAFVFYCYQFLGILKNIKLLFY